MLVIASMKSLNGAEQKQHINSVEVDIFSYKQENFYCHPVDWEERERNHTI
jgi:hypothetical protein